MRRGFITRKMNAGPPGSYSAGFERDYDSARTDGIKKQNSIAGADLHIVKGYGVNAVDVKNGDYFLRSTPRDTVQLLLHSSGPAPRSDPWLAEEQFC